ncbi:hypothetical protein HanIR_Chr11g0533251 [Helianthus annuus]|nr:hypothetical protein HanIR_Chr11g0533251 [Helianthus annuus]
MGMCLRSVNHHEHSRNAETLNLVFTTFSNAFQPLIWMLWAGLCDEQVLQSFPNNCMA